MARIYVDDTIIIGNESEWVKTSYEVYTDDSMAILLFKEDESDDRDMIIATLRYPNGELYPPENGSYARVKLHLENGTYSRWHGVTCA